MFARGMFFYEKKTPPEHGFPWKKVMRIANFVLWKINDYDKNDS